MADKCLILLRRSSRLAPANLGRLSRQSGTFTSRRALFQGRAVPSSSASKAFSSSSQDVGAMQQTAPEGNRRSVNSSKAAATPVSSSQDLEDPALFQPFGAAEDPAMYEKGTFQYLFENSQFVKAVDPTEKEVEGEITAMKGDKMYVDFGCKFHAVVTCPEAHRDRCHTGAKIIIALKDLEVTGHFIGDTKHSSLLEAEAKFVRLV